MSGSPVKVSRSGLSQKNSEVVAQKVITPRKLLRL